MLRASEPAHMEEDTALTGPDSTTETGTGIGAGWGTIAGARSSAVGPDSVDSVAEWRGCAGRRASGASGGTGSRAAFGDLSVQEMDDGDECASPPVRRPPQLDLLSSGSSPAGSPMAMLHNPLTGSPSIPNLAPSQP